MNEAEQQTDHPPAENLHGSSQAVLLHSSGPTSFLLGGSCAIPTGAGPWSRFIAVSLALRINSVAAAAAGAQTTLTGIGERQPISSPA